MQEFSDHSPQCDGEEIWCHNNCPIQYMETIDCAACEGAGRLEKESLMYLVINVLTDLTPIQQSELLETVFEEAEGAVSNETKGH